MCMNQASKLNHVCHNIRRSASEELKFVKSTWKNIGKGQKRRAWWMDGMVVDGDNKQQEYQSMPGDTYDRTCTGPHACEIPGMSKKSPVPTSLSTVQLHMPNKDFVIATAILVTVTFYSYSSALFCCILN